MCERELKLLKIASASAASVGYLEKLVRFCCYVLRAISVPSSASASASASALSLSFSLFSARSLSSTRYCSFVLGRFWCPQSGQKVIVIVF